MSSWQKLSLWWEPKVPPQSLMETNLLSGAGRQTTQTLHWFHHPAVLNPGSDYTLLFPSLQSKALSSPYKDWFPIIFVSWNNLHLIFSVFYIKSCFSQEFAQLYPLSCCRILCPIKMWFFHMAHMSSVNIYPLFSPFLLPLHPVGSLCSYLLLLPSI